MLKNGHAKLLELLLADEKVELDSKDHYGSTPLLVAVKNGREELVKRLLFTEGVKLDSLDTFGRTPLWWARRNGYPHIFNLILDKAKKKGIFICDRDLLI